MSMRIALGQINTTIGDWEGNAGRILAFYRKAVEGHGSKPDLVLFPELCVTGYPPRDLLLRESFVAANLATLEKIAAQAGEVPMLVGFVDRVDSGPGPNLANAAALLRKGKIEARVHKTLLPTYDVFDEDRYFRPAEKNTPLTIAGRRVGVTICEDLWNDADFWPKLRYPRDPVADLKAQGAELLVNLSASPWQLGKQDLRRKMLETVAVKDGLPVVYCNAVGGNDELIFDGNSFALNRAGKIVAQAAAFSEEILFADPDSDRAIDAPAQPKAQELYEALRLGLGDYVRKCGFQSAIIGLSGGIDSAVTAVLAADALGKGNVLGVAMPSRYSSDHSLEDARSLAANLGIRFEVVSIQEPVDVFLRLLGPLFGGKAADTTEENIQSRVRGMILMALSNKLGGMVLSTGNKSELATGYCTLYGDMAGGLAVLCDVPKVMVYELARWMNREREIIPPRVLTKPPSAELRPNQTDQDSLPPYDVLDLILKAYVEEHQPLRRIAESGFDPGLVRDLTRKIDFAEYKRRQAAPGLKATSIAFGIGRRMPIAQKFKEDGIS